MSGPIMTADRWADRVLEEKARAEAAESVRDATAEENERFKEEISKLREITKGMAIPFQLEITPKGLDRIIRERGAEFVAVVDAAKAMLEKTSNADGVHYIVECEAWDALHAALRPFLPERHPDEAF